MSLILSRQRRACLRHHETSPLLCRVITPSVCLQGLFTASGPKLKPLHPSNNQFRVLKSSARGLRAPLDNAPQQQVCRSHPPLDDSALFAQLKRTRLNSPLPLESNSKHDSRRGCFVRQPSTPALSLPNCSACWLNNTSDRSQMSSQHHDREGSVSGVQLL